MHIAIFIAVFIYFCCCEYDAQCLENIDHMHKTLVHEIIWWLEFCHISQNFFNTALCLALIVVMLNILVFVVVLHQTTVCDHIFIKTSSVLTHYYEPYVSYLVNYLLTASVNYLNLLYDWSRYFNVNISKQMEYKM